MTLHCLSVNCWCHPTVERVPAGKRTTVVDDLWTEIDRLAAAFDAASARADKAEAALARVREQVEGLALGPGTMTTDGETTTYLADAWAYRAAVLAIIDEEAGE